MRTDRLRTKEELENIVELFQPLIKAGLYHRDNLPELVYTAHSPKTEDLSFNKNFESCFPHAKYIEAMAQYRLKFFPADNSVKPPCKPPCSKSDIVDIGHLKDNKVTPF